MTIQRRAFSGIVAGGASFLVTLMLTLLQVPLLLRYWGPELYGTWNTLFAFYSLLISLETGHQSYLGAIFLQKIRGNREELKKTLGSGIRISCVLGVVQLSLCLVIGGFELTRFLVGTDTSVISDRELALALAALVLQWALAGSIGGTLAKIFFAGGYYTRAMVWGIGQRIVFTAALCGGAMTTGRILPSAALVALAITCSAFLQMMDFKRLFPDLYPWWGKGSWAEGWLNFSRSFLVTISGAIQQFGTNGLVLLITHLINTVAVALFTTLRTLANTAMQATLIVVQPMLPDLIRYHVAGEGQKVGSTLAGLWFVSGMIVNLGLAIAIAIAPPFYEYWTRGRLPFDATLFALLAIGIQIRNIASPLLIYLYGLNDVSAQMKIAVGQTVGTLALGAISMSFFGIQGAGVGVVMGELIAAGFAFHFVGRAVAPVGLTLKLEHLTFSLIGLGLIATGYIQNILWPGHAPLTTLIILISLLVLAGFNWRSLPDAVRTRILSVFRNPLA